MRSRVVPGLGLYVAVAGLVGFTGWAADVRRLTDWANNGISIQPNATVAAMAMGTALLLAAWGRRRPAALLGGLVALIGAATLSQHLLGWDLGIDRLFLFDRAWGARGTMVPGRMGVPGSTSWTLLGSAMVLSTQGPHLRRLAMGPAAIAMSIATLSLIGYLLGADTLYLVPRLTTIAFQTAIMILAAGVAIAASLPDHQPTRVLLEDSAAGELARRALPFIIGGPIAIGYLRLLGQRAGLYDTEMGVAIFAFSVIALLSAVLWWGVATVAAREHLLAEASAFNARAKAALDTIREEFAIVDDQWRLSYLNHRAVDIESRPASEWLERSLWESHPRLVGTPVEAALRRAMDERVAGSLEYQDPGTGRWLDVRISPLDPAGVALLLLDITDRKEDEAERIAATQLLATLGEVAGRVSDPDELLDESCRVVGRHFAASRCELTDTGTTASDDPALLRIPLRRGDREVAALVIGHDQPYPWTDERLRLGRAVAERIWLAVENARFGAIVRHNEQRFRHLAGSMPQIVYVTDGRGVVTYINERWTEYTGQVGAQTADLAAVVHPGDLPTLVGSWTEARESGRGYSAEFRLKRAADGSYRWFLTRALPIRNQAGEIVEWYGTSTDIGDQKRDQELLREADRRKDEFLATLAHELRNPLAPIRTSLELMRRAPDDAALAARSRDIMERQLGHMVRLVDDLMDRSRLVTNKLGLKVERVELAAVIRDAVTACQTTIEEAQHQLVLALPPKPIHLDGDPVRLAQVFSNLISNACKYSERGGRITIDAARADDEVTVGVRDTGVGIPADMIGRVFDLFEQGDSTPNQSRGGLGLGLTLVKRLVELHGGRVTVESEGLGRGSLFRITLPIAGIAPRASAPYRPSRPLETVVSKRVLVVDDNYEAAATLAMLLEMSGHTVAVAHDGPEAIAKAAVFRPEVMLVDLGLPKLSGHDVCREVRKEGWGEAVTMIALTGWGQESDRERSKEAGFDGHLIKPVDYHLLLASLQQEGPARSG